MEHQEIPSTSSSTMPQGYVHLNVGGTCYTTSLSTLTRYPDSMLYKMFTQEHIPLAKDDMGRYIIDRDGVVFRYILNFLREGNMNLPPSFEDYEQLSDELEFYQLNEMKEILRLRQITIHNSNNGYHLPREHYTHIKAGNADFILESGTLDTSAPLTKIVKNTEVFTKCMTTRDVITINFDPNIFKLIFNFVLRTGSFLPRSQTELTKLKEAIKTYNIPEFLDFLD